MVLRFRIQQVLGGGHEIRSRDGGAVFPGKAIPQDEFPCAGGITFRNSPFVTDIVGGNVGRKIFDSQGLQHIAIFVFVEIKFIESGIQPVSNVAVSGRLLLERTPVRREFSHSRTIRIRRRGFFRKRGGHAGYHAESQYQG